MRAFDPEVVNALWSAIEPLIPVRSDHHPLGCHRPRKSDRDCFEVMLVRLVTGCSWVDAERLTKGVVSDTTARQRRDEWIAAGVFDAIAEEAVSGYNKIIGLDLAEVAVDGSIHRAPAGGQGTGKSYFDRGKLGWKWSIATDTQGIPLGWTIAVAQTGMTTSCLRPPSTRSKGGDCWGTSRPCGLTEAMALTRSGPIWRAGAWTT